MKKMSKIKKLITHDGSFHADDVFACATLCLFLEKKNEKFKIIRTRDEKIIIGGDYVFDVGGVYNAKKNRFDHHQKGGPGKRKNGIKYSSFGLVWKKFGNKLTGSKKISDRIDRRLVSSVDAYDNGLCLFEKKNEVSPFLIEDFFDLLSPTWREDIGSYDRNFLRALAIAKEGLTRIIIRERDAVLAERKIIEIYRRAKDKRIIVFNNPYTLGGSLDKFPEPLFIVSPKGTMNVWILKAVRKRGRIFEARKDLPQKWGGLQNGELQKVTGVPDALFCHRGLFIATAKSKKGAIKLAQIAVRS